MKLLIHPKTSDDDGEHQPPDIDITPIPRIFSNHLALYLGYKQFSRFRVMSAMSNRERQYDEYMIDFDDTSGFVIGRWKELISQQESELSNSDRQSSSRFTDCRELEDDLRNRRADPATRPATKTVISQIQPLPRTLANLHGTFAKRVHPHEVNAELLWGFVWLNIELSSEPTDKLKRTAEWMNRIRRVIELFNRCLSVCGESEHNEARLAMIEVFDNLFVILMESIKYLHRWPDEHDARKHWPVLTNKINGHISDIDATVKHLTDITSYSRVNFDRQIRNLTHRQAPVPEPEEHGNFPIMMLPHERNPKFYGREEELEGIDKYLNWRYGNPELRTYTIYGRRGVGKTETALAYAYRHERAFDAVFWIQCETSVSLRTSFTKMAVALSLPGADRDGHHEENLMAVHRWLKITKRRWLLIFDNAEKEPIMKSYWPRGASGAILITSRSHYNFSKDYQRQGKTVEIFNPEQSWGLLCQLRSDEFASSDDQQLVIMSENNAAREFLGKLHGLPLAIQQMASVIKNPIVGGTTVASTYETFQKVYNELPPRQVGERTPGIRALDTLFDMAFRSLKKNSRILLSVLALLTPDVILIDLFLPRNQSALDGKLDFCKQPSVHIDDRSQAALSQVIIPVQALLDARTELKEKNLIKQEGRTITVHREVQQAMNYHSREDLQESFNSAIQLVAEAFPKRIDGSMFSQWRRCQTYIQDGAHLSQKFDDYTRPRLDMREPQLIGNETFVSLMSNCAWYSYEIGDYDLALRTIASGKVACKSKESLQFADLCNTAGMCYYELNKLQDCRENLELAMAIRKTMYPPMHDEVAAVYHNMGNLESASGRLGYAMEYFTKVVDIHTTLGDKSASQLALVYLCIGRVHHLRLEYDMALNWYAKSEALFNRTADSNQHFMAHVHYAYGNVEYIQQNYGSARRSYKECLRIALDGAPIHPITASAYYSLGCVEHKLRNFEVAKSQLDKARNIAELRSPNRDDGTIARILWKTSKVMEEDLLGAAEVAEFKNRAEIAKAACYANGETSVVVARQTLRDDGFNIDEIDNEDDEETSYDELVPGFFR